MVEAARRALARFGDRIEYVVADLGRPLPVEEPVDAVLSTATFHWVPDHDALFRNLAAVTRPGGWLVASAAASATSTGQASRREHRRRLARPRPLRDARGHGTSTCRGRLRRHRLLADRGADALRAW
jgi:trans-aconitate methyltransferase